MAPLIDRRKALLALGGGGLILSALALGLWRFPRKAPMQTSGTSSGKKMPVLFLGHGSPMNAIQENDFTRRLNQLGGRLPRPSAILCVSAHWMTQGFWVTAMDRPKTIHDFHGFPKALFDVQYPAPGSRETAALVTATSQSGMPGGRPGMPIQPDDHEWGLDHGTWSVLRHLYPKADVPVLQLSIDLNQSGETHRKLGEQLRSLREKGVLIVGSGNIVHNLRRISWEENAPAMDWALEFDAWAKKKLESRDLKALTEGYAATEAGRLAVPTVDHYYPLLTVLGATDEKDALSFEYEGIQNGSISMRAVGWGMG